MAEAGNKVIHPLFQRILETKAREVELHKRLASPEDMRKRAGDAPPARPFAGGILACNARHKVIAEIKRISPGTGQARRDFDPVAIAKSYEAAGAAALSVLTDTVFFGGSLDVLAMAREAVALPVLRKDFIIDPYQVYEARACGADAVLLMAVNFDSREKFQELIGIAQEAGLETLLEVHDESELEYLPVTRQNVGVNNRDFRHPDLKVDTRTTFHVAKMVKNARLLVSESGIDSASSTSSNSRRAAGNAAASAWPMPGACEPCPGKTKARFMSGASPSRRFRPS